MQGSSNSPIGVRRNIQAVSKEERKQYFWCLKMLGILPPFELLKERKFATLGTRMFPWRDQPNYYVEPKNLHD